MCKKIVLVLGFVLLISSTVNAEMLVRDYQRFIQSPHTQQEMKDFVGAMGWGIHYYNDVMKSQDRDRLFCLPESFYPNQEIFINVLNQELTYLETEGKEYKETAPLPVVLLIGLSRRYPCPN